MRFIYISPSMSMLLGDSCKHLGKFLQNKEFFWRKRMLLKAVSPTKSDRASTIALQSGILPGVHSVLYIVCKFLYFWFMVLLFKMAPNIQE